MYKTILLLYGFLWAIGVLNYLLIRFLIKSRKLTDVPTNRGFYKFIFSSKIRHVDDSIFYWSCLSYRWLSILFIVIFFTLMFFEFTGFGITSGFFFPSTERTE